MLPKLQLGLIFTTLISPMLSLYLCTDSAEKSFHKNEFSRDAATSYIPSKSSFAKTTEHEGAFHVDYAPPQNHQQDRRRPPDPNLDEEKTYNIDYSPPHSYRSPPNQRD
ncbi:hypothetical protein KP509_04G018900 [Ceratopteris richardii]|uniref:Uncharacterized protein n=1 Tax=Ceratopteris richardii TaxID=49495 RepID=A0A8T2UV12_CERRI|nr:hypothetical protein KP509_04G018900 [Ceratopteris richardii]